MNIEQIKKMGAYLGLEAELANQQRYVTQHIKDKKWEAALQSLRNSVEVLEAIVDLTNKVKREEEPCVLTSAETNSKPSETL